MQNLEKTVRFNGSTCEVYRTEYPAGGATALVLIEQDTGEPYATATVNLPEITPRIPVRCLLVKDYSENEGILAALEEAGVVEDTGQRVLSGFVELPVARLLC